MSENKWMPGMLLRHNLGSKFNYQDYRVIEVDELFDGERYTALTCVQLISGVYAETPKVEIKMFYPERQKDFEPVKSDFATALCLAELRARTWEPGVSH